MATLNGREAAVKIDTDTITEIGSWSMDMSNEEIDTTAFGSTWGKTDVGMRKWNLTVEGNYDPADTTGQGVIETAWSDGTLVNNIRVYVDNTSYWVPDTTTDASAGGRVTSYALAQDKSGVATISFTLSGSGPITFV